MGDVGVLSATSNAGTTVSAAVKTEDSIGWSAIERKGRSIESSEPHTFSEFPAPPT